MTTTVSPTVHRSLAAIVLTDAVGFSKRMSQDEDTALSIINHDLQLIGELCKSFDGKVLKTTGDGMLMYFVSAVQAVTCAIEIQNTFSKSSTTVPIHEHFTHRIGVHLGDIFFNNEDIMGTAVNIAARLEAAAEPGAICMSQVVYEVVKYRLDLDVSYAGELVLKNIAQRVSAYHVWPRVRRMSRNTDPLENAVIPLITPLNTVLNTLSIHPECYRIKKLLYAIHQGRWEESPDLLAGLSLKLLLESLTECNLTLSECQLALNAGTTALNKAEEYREVIAVILDSLKDFYGEENAQLDRTFQPESAPPPRTVILKSLSQDISNNLDNAQEQLQIKQILYFLCCGQWETQSDRIQAVPMRALIQELYQQIESLPMLEKRLRCIEPQLNNRPQYMISLNTIVRECQPLYQKVLADGALTQ